MCIFFLLKKKIIIIRDGKYSYKQTEFEECILQTYVLYRINDKFAFYLPNDFLCK